MDLNKVQIIGNITQDIVLKNTPNGQSVTNFSVATNRYWNDASGNRQEQSEFHNIVFWGKQAEIASQYLTKGQKIYIEGRLQTRSWEGQDGTKRYTTEIVWENMIMLGGKNENAGSSNSYNQEPKGMSNPSMSKSTPKQEEEISVDDLPF